MFFQYEVVAFLKIFSIIQSKMNLKKLGTLQEDIISLIELKQAIQQSYQSIKCLHDNFQKHIVKKCEHYQESMNQIKQIFDAQQAILLNMGIKCKNLNLQACSNLFLIMHIQKLTFIKWILQNKNFITTKNDYIISQCPLPPFQPKTILLHPEKQIFVKKAQPNLIKQDLQRQLQDVFTDINDEFMNLRRQALENKEMVNKIEASEIKIILNQTVKQIADLSYNLNKFTQTNQIFFEETFNDLNLTKFFTIQNQLDCSFTMKFKVFCQKISYLFRKFLVEKVHEKQKVTKEVEIQVEIIEDKKSQIELQTYKMGQKKLNQQIQKLRKECKFQKDQIQKLEQLVREKAVSYKQNLLKVRGDSTNKAHPLKNENKVNNISTHQIINSQQEFESCDLNNISMQLCQVQNSEDEKEKKQKSIGFQKQENDQYYIKLKQLMTEQMQIYKKTTICQIDQCKTLTKQPSSKSRRAILKDNKIREKDWKSRSRIKIKTLNQKQSDTQVLVQLFTKLEDLEKRRKNRKKSHKKILFFASNIYNLQFTFTKSSQKDSIFGSLINSEFGDDFIIFQDTQKSKSSGGKDIENECSKSSSKQQDSSSIKLFSIQKMKNKRQGKRNLRQSLTNQSKRSRYLKQEKNSLKKNSLVSKFMPNENEQKRRFKKDQIVDSENGTDERKMVQSKCSYFQEEMVNEKNNAFLKQNFKTSSNQSINAFEVIKMKNTNMMSTYKRNKHENLTGNWERSKMTSRRCTNLYRMTNNHENIVNFSEIDVRTLYLDKNNALEGEIYFGFSSTPPPFSRSYNQPSRTSRTYSQSAQNLKQMIYKLEKTLSLFKKYNNKNYNTLSNIFRFPYSVLQNKIQVGNQISTPINLKVIVNFIHSLHVNCDNCEHLKNFMKKIAFDSQ